MARASHVLEAVTHSEEDHEADINGGDNDGTVGDGGKDGASDGYVRKGEGREGDGR